MLPKPQGTWANAPFDDVRPGADLILQSSDDVYFRVSKFTLTLVSPVFADMLSLPLPASQDPSEIQVVALSEDSTTLDLCLRHLYPVQTPDAVPLCDASALGEFTRKYQIDVLNEAITRYLVHHVRHDPIGVYAIAVTYEQRDIGEIVARACLTLPFSHLLSYYVPGAMAEHHAELLRYHVACGEAASAVASKREWFSSLRNCKLVSIGYSNGCAECMTKDVVGASNSKPIQPVLWGQRQSAAKRYGPHCLWNYLHRSALVLAHHPTPKAVADKDFVLKGHDCPSCPSDMGRQMLKFSGYFQREIQKAVERVPIPRAVTDSETITF